MEFLDVCLNVLEMYLVMAMIWLSKSGGFSILNGQFINFLLTLKSSTEKKSSNHETFWFRNTNYFYGFYSKFNIYGNQNFSTWQKNEF